MLFSQKLLAATDMTEEGRDEGMFGDMFLDTILTDEGMNQILEEVADDLHARGSGSTKAKRQLLELRHHLHMSQGDEVLAGLTLKEIADLTGYSQARVGQIHKEAIRKYKESEYFQEDGEMGGNWYFQEGN